MKQQKAIFLFLALILPICIFLFLKLFGKNEFAVKPLYEDTYPDKGECVNAVTLPYAIPDSVLSQLPFEGDSLVLLVFGEKDAESGNQLKRIKETLSAEPLKVVQLVSSGKHRSWKNCIFFLKDPYNLVLVDRQGVIRGQYVAGDREEVDRLLTEVAIILKKY